MDPRDEFQALVREIEPLPLEIQFDLLLDFFGKMAGKMDTKDVTVLKADFATRGDHVGQLLAEILEGQLALRRIQG